VDSNWLAGAAVLIFGIVGGVWAAFHAGGAPSHIRHIFIFCVVGFVFSALLGVFVIVILVLLLGAVRQLFRRAYFARARRHGDSDAIETLRTDHGDGEGASDPLGRSINARLESETSATRERRGPTS
jgi:uncharacterized membrane protein